MTVQLGRRQVRGPGCVCQRRRRLDERDRDPAVRLRRLGDDAAAADGERLAQIDARGRRRRVLRAADGVQEDQTDGDDDGRRRRCTNAVRPVARSRSLAPLGAATGGSTTWAGSVVTRIERRLRHPIPARCADRSVGLLAPVRPRARPQPRRPRSPGDVVDGGVRARNAPAPEGYRVVEHFYRRSNRLHVGARLRGPAKAAEHLAGLRGLRRAFGRDRPDVVHVQWAVVRPVDRRFYHRVAAIGHARRLHGARSAAQRRRRGPPPLGRRDGAVVQAGHLPQRVGAAGARRALRRARRPRPGDSARRLPVPARRAGRPGPAQASGPLAALPGSCGRTRAPTSSSGPGRPSAISSQERRSSSPAGR